MEENIKNFKKIFKKIKNNNLNKSLRSGSTGPGYTYESLIGKKEDNSYLPDYDGIEIKTKTGYSKSSITLFTLVPQSENGIKYLYNNYSYSRIDNSEYKIFRGDVYANQNCLIGTKYFFSLKVDYQNRLLRLKINDIFFKNNDSSIYWTFDELKNRIEIKLSTLAVVNNYPYKRKGEIYYKYTKSTIYKFKNFETFLNLIEKGIIYITFNVDTFFTEKRYGQVHDRGTGFRIKKEYIDMLFDKID